MNMNSKIVARFLGAFLIAAAFLSPKVFAAEPTDSVRTQTVKFEDLNLSTQAGTVALYQRIHQAAKQVCEQGDARDLGAMQMQRSCIVRAESRAVDNVHSGALSAYYQTKLGHTYAVVAQNNVK